MLEAKVLSPLPRPLVMLVWGVLAAWVQAGAAPANAGQQTSGPTVLRARCLSCHDSIRRPAGIDLSSRSGAASAAVLGPGDPAKSRLVRAVTGGKMPPTGKLPAGEIAALRAWIQAGAPYPSERLEALKVSDQPLWSLEPVRRPPAPRTRFDALAKNPVDRFMFQQLQAKGLRPSPPASPRELLRRVTFDLTGLPPTPEETAQFLKDRAAEMAANGRMGERENGSAQSPNPPLSHSPTLPLSHSPTLPLSHSPTPPFAHSPTQGSAYERLVDRLLVSPAYGERWAQQWLDVVRFGESQGYEQNHLRPTAWPYRDYVIRALNEDRPYDRFVAEQLAGDMLAHGDPYVDAATGFLVAGVHDTVGNRTEEGTRQQRVNDLDDLVSTTSETFLGLTAGCAKCHDHKFDPIPQKDYYRLAAVFAGVRHGERALGGAGTVSGPGRHTESFAPVAARFVRFVIAATADGTEPCLDELEVYGGDPQRNLALAAEGGKATASSLLPGYAIHQVAHLNDALLGNDHSWISAVRGQGWAQIELPRAVEVRRVVWSRDGTASPRFSDRVPSSYHIDVSTDGGTWTTAISRAPAPTGGVVAAGMQAYAGQLTPPDPIFVLRRGDVMQRADEVSPGALSRIPALSPELPAAPEAERRLALARWITDPRNPLTARVIVNRVWQGHFGRGIVATPSDFGHNGAAPTHPELLDFLASVFVGSPQATGHGPQSPSRSGQGTVDSRLNLGWRLKELHRLIVTSYAYQQSSSVGRALAAGRARGRGRTDRSDRTDRRNRVRRRAPRLSGYPNPQSAIRDPQSLDAGNLLLWRMPLRRLEAEAVRDSILAVSGKLDRRMGGPSFPLYRYRTVNVAIYEPLERYGPETWRRSVYRQAARAVHDDLLGAFDCPETAQRNPRRPSTTTALQALSLLNGPFVLQQAGFFAERVRSEAGPDTGAQVDRAFTLAFGRAPSAEERRDAIELAGRRGMPALCRALFNANEFLYY